LAWLERDRLYRWLNEAREFHIDDWQRRRSLARSLRRDRGNAGDRFHTVCRSTTSRHLVQSFHQGLKEDRFVEGRKSVDRIPTGRGSL